MLRHNILPILQYAPPTDEVTRAHTVLACGVTATHIQRISIHLARENPRSLGWLELQANRP